MKSTVWIAIYFVTFFISMIDMKLSKLEIVALIALYSVFLFNRFKNR